MSLHRNLLCLIAFQSICFFTYAGDYDFNERCQNAYDLILSLQLDKGLQLVKQENAESPENLIPYLLQDYVDFLTVFTSEQESDYHNLKSKRDSRLKKLRKGDASSPYFLYSIAEVHLHWAVLKVRFGDYLKAIFEIRKAYKLLEENQQKFPDFMANYKSLGLLHTVLGSIPDQYKWGLAILGMEGEVRQGMKELRLVLDHAQNQEYIFEDETVILYSFLLFHLEKKSEDAWSILETYGFPEEQNLMHVFTVAHIGVYSGKTLESIQVLTQRPTGTGYQSFPVLDYLLGLAKLHRLDEDADRYFQKYLDEYKGFNHIKSAHQKLAWHSLLKEDTNGYRQEMQLAEIRGATIIDADKQAFKEAVEKQIPNTVLLRARILFDGAAFALAEQTLLSADPNDFKREKDRAEYLYRLGRIYHEWNREEESIVCYLKTIESGHALPYYFAANAALQLGYIYEQSGQTENAAKYYEACMSFKKHEYKNSLDQKAKAGLNRLKSHFN